MAHRLLSFTVAASAVLMSPGCGTLVRAVKGELTPIGVDQASAGDVSTLGGKVAATDDPGEFVAAFRDLTSVYLYKCMENPSKAPRDGKADVRTRAGDALVQATTARVKRHGADDPLVGTVDAQLSSLKGQVSKCDASKLGKQDPGGKLDAAIAMMQPEGRAARVAEHEAAADETLAEAIAAGDNDLALRRWMKQTCPQLLPADGCYARAVDAAYDAGKWDTLVRTFLAAGPDYASTVLPGLAQRKGVDEVTDKVHTQLLGEADLPGFDAGLSQMADFLVAQERWGSCKDRKDALTRMITEGDQVTATWAMTKVVQDECRELDRVVIKSLGSDSSQVRKTAAWAIGELRIEKGKKHLDRLRYTDPYYSNGCWCHPVRDAAKLAFNKLELDE